MAIITTVAITALVANLAKKGLEKAFETAGEKLSEGASKWIKSIFYDEDGPKNIVENLVQNPDSNARKKAVESLINIDLEDNPGNEKFLGEVYEKTVETNISIANSKNVNTGNINTGGGSVHIGDSNGRE